jgi:hypothetical protein
MPTRRSGSSRLRRSVVFLTIHHYRAQFVRTLDSSRRVVLEVIPTQRIAIDLAKMHTGATMYEPPAAK